MDQITEILNAYDNTSEDVISMAKIPRKVLATATELGREETAKLEDLNHSYRVLNQQLNCELIATQKARDLFIAKLGEHQQLENEQILIETKATQLMKEQLELQLTSLLELKELAHASPSSPSKSKEEMILNIYQSLGIKKMPENPNPNDLWNVVKLLSFY